MSKKKTKHRWLNILLIIFGIIVIIVVALFLSADYYLESRVKREISKYFRDDPSSMYNIEFKQVSISTITGDFSLSDLKVVPKDAYIDSLNNDYLNVVLHITADRFEVNNLDIKNLILNGLIDIKSIELIHPEIRYVYNPDVKLVSETKPLNEILSDVFVSANIQKLDIEDASIVIDNIRNEEIVDYKIDSASLHVTDIHIDTSYLRRSVPLEFNDLRMDVHAVYIGSLDMYYINFDNYEISVKDSLTSITNFSLLVKENLMDDQFKKTNIRRRDFIKKAAKTVSVIAGIVAIPVVVRQIIPRKSEQGIRFKLGLPSDYPVNIYTFDANHNIFIYRDYEGIRIMSARCTHLGCIIEKQDDGFICPCHGSCYNHDGKVISGAAPTDLPWLKARLTPDGKIMVEPGKYVNRDTKLYIS